MSIGVSALPSAQVTLPAIRLDMMSVPAFIATASHTPARPIAASTVAEGVASRFFFAVDLTAGERAQGHAEMGGSLNERRGSGVGVDGGQRGQGARSDPTGFERGIDQRHDLGCGNPARAAEPGDYRFWVDEQTGSGRGTFGEAQQLAALTRYGISGQLEPARQTLDAQLFAL